MTTTAKIGPCCEGARRIEAQDMLLEYWCPDHGKTLPRPRDPATTSGSPSSPTYNHTRGDSALNPCRACFDAQTPDERWAALANAASEAENVRRSLRVALHALRYLRGEKVRDVDGGSRGAFGKPIDLKREAEFVLRGEGEAHPWECVCSVEHYDNGDCKVHPCTEGQCKRGHGGNPCPVAYPPTAPFPPSTRGEQQPDGSRTWTTGDPPTSWSARKAFEAGFAAAWPEEAPWPDDPNVRTRAVELADALKKAGLA